MAQDYFPIVVNYQQRPSLIVTNTGTVGELKQKCFDQFQIDPSKDLIWNVELDDDTQELSTIFKESPFELYFATTEDEYPEEHIPDEFSDFQCTAALKYVEYFYEKYNNTTNLLHICILEDAIEEACRGVWENRKVLLLYFHDENDQFSDIFNQTISKPNVANQLNSNFILLGWDLNCNKECKRALSEALDESVELSVLKDALNEDKASAYFIMPVNESIQIFLKVSDDHTDDVDTILLNAINQSEKYLTEQKKTKSSISEDERNTAFTAKEFQQTMLNLLGDRQYDNFDAHEHEHLKNKISYALFGPPPKDGPKSEKEEKSKNKLITLLFETILRESKNSKREGQVVVSFIYNCAVSLSDSNQLAQTPIFVLRKCEGSATPCRIFIDATGRVYGTWRGYITENTLQQCEMALPLEGKYTADENGEVLLEYHLSPACSTTAKIGKVINYVASGAAIFAGVVIGTSFAVAVSPLVLSGALSTAVTTGVYSVVKGATHIHDRRMHKESLSLSNSQARAAYLNIIAGALNFVVIPGNTIASIVAAEGVVFGKGTAALITTMNILNVSGGGAAAANNFYNVINVCLEENRVPSSSELLQVTSALMFFCQAVYSFQTANDILTNAQNRVLKDFQNILNNPRERSAFNKFYQSIISKNEGNITQANAEVIIFIKRIPNNTLDIIPVLKQATENLNVPIEITNNNEHIQLNGVDVNLNTFTNIDEIERITYLGEFDRNQSTPQSAIDAMKNIFGRSLGLNESDLYNFAESVVTLLGRSDMEIQEILTKVVSQLVTKVLEKNSLFQNLHNQFFGQSTYFKIFVMVCEYFQSKVNQLEEKFNKWLQTKDERYEESVFLQASVHVTKRAVTFFLYIANSHFNGAQLTEEALKELTKYFYNWGAKELYGYGEHQRIRHAKQESNELQRQKCKDCEGWCYSVAQ